MVWYCLSLSEFLVSPGVTHTPPPHPIEASRKGWYSQNAKASHGELGWFSRKFICSPIYLPSSLPPSFLLPPLSSLLPSTFLYSSIFSHSPSLISGHTPPPFIPSLPICPQATVVLVLCGQLPLTSPVRTSPIGGTSHLCSLSVLLGTTDNHQLSLFPLSSPSKCLQPVILYVTRGQSFVFRFFRWQVTPIWVTWETRGAVGPPHPGSRQSSG